jgi:cyclophilin family peptidyl-prolyl cis-trans isomerase
MTVVLVLVGQPALAEKTDRAALIEQHDGYRKLELQAAGMALTLRRLQTKLVDTRRALARFRQGKAQEDLQKPQFRAQAALLLREELAARAAYEAKGQGEPWKLFQRLKRETLPTLLKALQADLGAFVSEHPNDPELRLLRARLSIDCGETESARADAKAVLTARPADATALTVLARCDEDDGLLVSALALYRRALEVEASDERRVRCAMACFQLNRFADAQTLRNAVVDRSKLSPALTVAWELSLDATELEAFEKQWAEEKARRASEAKAADLPRVELTTSRGPIVLELFEDQAPNTVANFLTLVDRGFYTGMAWGTHRFYASSGDPATRKGADAKVHGPGYTIKDELEGARPLFRGTLTLAPSKIADGGGSRFVILHRPLPPGSGLVPFGRVVEGLETVATLKKGDALVSAKVTRRRDHPYEPKTIR